MSAPVVAALPPWLLPDWRRLVTAVRDGRLGHAWLLSGSAGLGKRLLARHLTRALLCAKPEASGDPCGVCAECRLVLGGNHPDDIEVMPDPKAASETIKIDSMRALTERDALMPHRGARKIVRIQPAEAMNLHAANALLKTLEEPAPSTLLLLISEDPGRLPATVRSRCQHLRPCLPTEAEALPWLRDRLGAEAPVALLLRLAHGAPLRALALADGDFLAVRETVYQEFVALAEGRCDPIAAAAAWMSLDVAIVLDALTTWICDLVRLGVDPRVAFIANTDKREALARLARRLAPAALHGFLRQLMQARRQLVAPLNRQLLLESLTIRWARTAAPQPPRN